VEVMRYGSSRVAYAMETSFLPTPTPGFEWREVKGFQPGDEILGDPELKEVFKAALENGFATVTKSS
jgi:hypothetical protein